GDGAYADQAVAGMRESLRGLIAYATDGSETALEALRRRAQEPEDLAVLLEALAPIARGGPQEVAMIAEALAHGSPAVQRGALAVAASAARRRPGLYEDTLAGALASESGEVRRLAFAAARRLEPERASELFRAAL